MPESASPSIRATATRASGPRPGSAGTYTSLSVAVRGAGLLERRRGFYLALIGGLSLCLLAAGAGVLLLGQTWYVLLVAGALGIVFTQFAFLAHEAAHRQMFASNRWNDATAKLLVTGLVGMSYTWWQSKHTRHHGNPNQVGKDPDIDIDTVSFQQEDAATRRGLAATLTRFQGYLFFPLLLLEGVNLHYLSLRAVLGRERGNQRPRRHWTERTLLLGRLGIYVAVLFWVMPPGIAMAFLGVQLGVFGFYMGSAFAPNHIGMRLVGADTRLDFLSKQVLTSRNIRGGVWVTVLFGGLNHQVEHHLFPNMPRPHLARARELVRRHCKANGVPYTEATLREAYRAVLAHMHQVGLAARDPFLCPLVVRYRT